MSDKKEIEKSLVSCFSDRGTLHPMKIYPSLIAADLLDLRRVIRELEAHCAGFHIDIMDFHFVDNLTWGPFMVNAIRKATDRQLWVHLMVDNPEKYLERFSLKAGDIVSIHYESVELRRLQQIIEDLRRSNLTVSIALKPETPVDVLVPLLPLIDHALIMSVNPGFSGQGFIPESLQRITHCAALKMQHNEKLEIGLDGGINRSNIEILKKFGATSAAIAAGIFSAENPVEELQLLKKLAI